MITKVNARELARAVLLDCGGDRNQAFDRLQKRAKKDPEVEQAIRDCIPLDTLIRDLIGDAGHGLAQASTRMATGDMSRLGPGQLASMLYYTPLWNGTPTRLAKRPDWLDEIHHRLSTIHGHRLALAFARKVLAHLTDDETTTEQVLTADALLELHGEASREVGQ